MTRQDPQAQRLYDATVTRLGSPIAALEFLARTATTPGTVISDEYVELLDGALDVAAHELSIETEVSAIPYRRFRN